MHAQAAFPRKPPLKTLFVPQKKLYGILLSKIPFPSHPASAHPQDQSLPYTQPYFPPHIILPIRDQSCPLLNPQSKIHNSVPPAPVFWGLGISNRQSSIFLPLLFDPLPAPVFWGFVPQERIVSPKGIPHFSPPSSPFTNSESRITDYVLRITFHLLLELNLQLNLKFNSPIPNHLARMYHLSFIIFLLFFLFHFSFTIHPSPPHSGGYSIFFRYAERIPNSENLSIP